MHILKTDSQHANTNWHWILRVDIKYFGAKIDALTKYSWLHSQLHIPMSKCAHSRQYVRT